MSIVQDPEAREIGLLLRRGSLTGKRVLEVGCGNGRLTWRYADHAGSVVAIDPDEASIAEAQASCPPRLKPKVRFQAQGILDYDPPQGSAFDLAILAWSL